MSYLLERQMDDRVEEYRREAAFRRSIPARSLRVELASALRRIADRVEGRRLAGPASGSRQAAIPGRNH